MPVSVKKTQEALDSLRVYSGANPYLLMLKRDIFTLGKKEVLNEFAIKYINQNISFTPQIIGKTVKIADWYGEKKKDDWKLDFIPEKIKIISLLGETDTTYHCYVQYRKSVDPVMAFLPKKAILGNFLVKDYNDYIVDFERYDRLSTAKDPNRKIKEHQKTAVKFLLSRKKCVLADDMGLGKMEPVSSLIPTTDGFKKMGDIKVGDYVFDRFGKKTKVLKTFEHKGKEIYRVYFSDGTFCDCGLEHMWMVRTKVMANRGKGWKVMSLKELIDSKLQYADNARIKNGLNPRSKYEIPVTNPVNYDEKEYFIHPYVLGYCIGDGNLCNGGINISIPDFEIESVDRIKSLLKDGFTLSKNESGACPRYRIIKINKNGKNEYHREIKRLGLNIEGTKKFIPDIYKLGSIEQRIDLLRGLMDSDGCIRDGNKILFSTSSEKLAYDVKELVFSLGGIARVHKYQRKERKNPEFHVMIQIKINPFKLTKKLEKYHPTFLKYCSKYIVSAEYLHNEDAKCLYVDSEDHTYLTGKDYIVTHNTTSATVAAIEGNFDSIIIICPASLKENWKKELLWYVPERDITIVDGFLYKTKGELEKFLGYGEGKSGKNVSELKEEARERGKWSENRFVIVNYDILEEFYDIPSSRSAENIEKALKNSPMLQFIKDKKSLIIIDEAHRLSNMGSKQYKIIDDLIKRGKPDSLYLLTGTPITNNPQNYYNLLKLIGDPITDDWKYYMERYCGAVRFPKNAEEKAKRNDITNNFVKSRGKYSWYDLTDEEKKSLNEIIDKNVKQITVAKDATNLEELKERTAHIYLRRLKEDLTDLNVKKNIHEVFYDFDVLQIMEYDRLWEEYENAQLELNPDKEINKELLEGAIYRKYCSNQMIPNTIKIVDSYVKVGRKVVIACCYDEELYTLKDHYGDSCVIFNGKMNQKEKLEAERLFREDDSKMILIGNIQAAGVGLNLVSASVMVFNNISFVPGEDYQMCDRIYRMGQTRDVDIYYQIFRNTQYEKMWNIVLRKSLVINQIVKKEDEK